MIAPSSTPSAGDSDAECPFAERAWRPPPLGRRAPESGGEPTVKGMTRWAPTYCFNESNHAFVASKAGWTQSV